MLTNSPRPLLQVSIVTVARGTSFGYTPLPLQLLHPTLVPWTGQVQGQQAGGGEHLPARPTRQPAARRAPRRPTTTTTTTTTADAPSGRRGASCRRPPCTAAGGWRGTRSGLLPGRGTMAQAHTSPPSACPACTGGAPHGPAPTAHGLRGPLLPLGPLGHGLATGRRWRRARHPARGSATGPAPRPGPCSSPGNPSLRTTATDPPRGSRRGGDGRGGGCRGRCSLRNGGWGGGWAVPPWQGAVHVRCRGAHLGRLAEGRVGTHRGVLRKVAGAEGYGLHHLVPGAKDHEERGCTCTCTCTCKCT